MIGNELQAIYARQFKWIIGRCNKTLDQRASDRKIWIGVLDIAGFEIFDVSWWECVFEILK